MVVKAIVFAASLFLLILIPSCAASAAWYVDASVAQSGNGKTWAAAFKTIQEGIDGSSDGDTVIVAEGAYIENIHFKGRNITLTSTDPLDPQVVAGTVIDGNQAGSVITFFGTEDETCVLSGFTVRNGKAGQGAGINGSGWDPAYRTKAAIRNNVIIGNTATGWRIGGGGLACCDGEIVQNTVTENSGASFETYGGGLYDCDGIIAYNTIRGNQVVNGAYGGGLYDCDGTVRGNAISENRSNRDGGGLSGCDGAIEGNVITGNSTVAGWGWERATGGGLHACGGAIQGNMICGNSANYRGGGLSGCSGTIQNNLICGNWAADAGGALASCGVVKNNTIVGNSARSGPGGGLFSCKGTIRNCIIWANSATAFEQLFECSQPTRSCIQDWTGGGEGNISWDPLFFDADGLDNDPQTFEDNDYHLSSASPCIDAGSAEDPPQDDVDGESRPQGPGVDMGADEYADADADGMLDYWELKYFGSLSRDGSGDFDSDGLSDAQEFGFGTSPTLRDTDADGSSDGIEISANTDANDPFSFPIFVDGENGDDGYDGRTPETAKRTIQAAIDAARDGVTVIVAEAIYFENIHFNGKNILLRSTDPLDSLVAQNTVIDGSISGSVVTFSGAEDETCVLSGFTIRKGRAYRGGGILGGSADVHTQVTIVHNVITENSAERGGGLIFCDGIIENNVVCWNAAADKGGGLYDCGGTIQNNTVCFNSAATGGGGLHTCSGIIVNCIIWGNSAPEGANLYDSSTPSYSCIQDWTGGGEGNISENPHFVDEAAHDYHLQSWSPCVDAGDPLSDFSSEPKPNGGRINMGAYGNTPEAAPASEDTDDDLLPDDWEMLFFRVLALTAAEDPDDDGVSNLDELHLGTDPTSVLLPDGALTVIVYNLNDPPNSPTATTITISPMVGTINEATYSNFLPADSYTVSVSAPNFSSDSKQISVSFKSPAAAVFFLVPDPGSVSGIVLDALSVAAILEAGVQLEAISGVYTGMTFDTSTALDGLFSLTDLPAAIDYRITVVRTSYDDYQATFTLNAGEEKDLGTISLERSIRIIGNELGEFTITWTSTAGMLYNVYCRDSLLEEWSLLASGIPASGDGETSWTDNPASEVKMRFYRVEGYPGP